MDEASEEALVARGISAHRDSTVDETPRVRQYPRVLYIVLCSYRVIHRESISKYGDVIPQGWYVVIHHDPVCHDPLSGKLGRRRQAVGHSLVPPLHLVPGLLVEGGGLSSVWTQYCLHIHF